MNETEIRDALLELLARIAPEVDPRTVDPGEPLQRVLDIDSFDFLNLLVAVRDRFGVSVAESDYGKVRSLDELVGYIRSKLG